MRCGCRCISVFFVLCRGVSVCADENIADRLGRSIDVIVSLSGDLLTLIFETGLIKGAAASLLVDDIRISTF